VARGRLEERHGFYAKSKLLVVDEFGYLPFETNAAHLPSSGCRLTTGDLKRE
jgi:DNA replication protein DnaC